MKEYRKRPRLFGLHLVAILTILFCFTLPLMSQEIVDKTVATINDGARTELITYSDLMWQLALQPNVQLEPPRSDDLNRALATLIDQRLFALEAGRLPRPAPSEVEIDKKIKDTLAYFPSTAAFESRLKLVGFDSIKDDNFERIMAERVAIDNYIDFRFRSFVVVTADEETRYYRDVFTPDFRRKYPGLLMPTLDEKRKEINATLTETKVASRLEGFLDDAKRRAEVDILMEV